MEVCQTSKDDRGPLCSLSLYIREILPHRRQDDNLEINKRDHALQQYGITEEILTCSKYKTMLTP